MRAKWGTRYGLVLEQAAAGGDLRREHIQRLVAHNDMSALKLRIPAAAHRAYHDKILLQREMICFVALMSIAKPGTLLQPVMLVRKQMDQRI